MAPMQPSLGPPRDEPRVFGLDKFNGDNFAEWSFKMENIFDHYDLLEVMEGMEKRSENDPEKSPWVQKSAQGYLLLGQALGSSQIRHIKPFQREPEKGPKAWAALKGIHAPATAAVAVVLERQMAALRIEEDEAVEEGVQKFFDLLMWLEGADLNYRQQASAVDMAVEGAEDEEVEGLEAATTTEAAGVADTAMTTRTTDAVADDSTASQEGRGAGGGRGKGRRGCGGRGGGAANMRNGDIESESRDDRFSGQFFFVSMQASAGPEKDEGFEEPAAVGKVTLHSLDYWVIDSGATCSMTPRADLLTELEPSPVKHVTSALGQRAEVKGMGKAMFKGADGKMVGLKSMLWVPNLAANLISVRRLQKAGMDTSSKGAKTYTARLGERLLWDLHEDRDVYNEMWQIPVVPMPKERQVAASISTKGEEVGSGGGANGRAKEMKSKKCNLGGTSKLGEHEESGAAAQKQHKGEENPKAAAEEEYGENISPLDEVVMDKVGPLKLGAAGAEYFLTIVDVYTRMTWVYVLSKRSDVAETVRTDWLPMVERQQDRLVKAIRTDRGGEFLSKEFGLWLKKNGIRHSLTLPYSPAMNGIAKRANRTITETARGLLIEAGLPDYFWPDASTAVFALVAELVDFAAACRLDYAAGLVAESESVCPPFVGGECALGTDLLEDRQEDLECLAATAPHLVSMLLAPEGDPDAPDIPTPRLTMRRSRVSTPLSGRQPWTQRWHPGSPQAPTVKRPPGSPPVFKARYVARGFCQREGADFFQTFSPTPKMTTLWVLLHVAAQRDYELHSLHFSTAFLQGSLHDEIWLRRPLGFTRSFPPGTQWSLRRPVYGLRQEPRECHNTLRTTLAALGFAPSTADPSLFVRTDTSLPPFYILVHVDDLVFATADSEALALVKSELQKRHTCTDLGELRSYLGLQITQDIARRTITLTQSHMVQQVLQRFGFTWSSAQATPLATGHSLSAPPSDESVEPSGPYGELVGCLIYLMTCTRRDLAYPLGLLARYDAPGWHRKVYMDAAKRVLRYLCSTSGMGLVLGGRGDVVLTGHSDASWVDNQVTQRSSQGYSFSLGSG
ncbi:unnamed protein product [Closterium sp. NIES-53]